MNHQTRTRQRTRLAASVWCQKLTAFSLLQTLNRNTTAHAVTVSKPLPAMMEEVAALEVVTGRMDEARGSHPLGRLLLATFGDTGIVAQAEEGLVVTMTGKIFHLIPSTEID